MANFYTDVIQADPRYNSPNRVADVALLEPVTHALVQKIITDAYAHGIELMVYETYRSQARQAQLFAQGASQLKTVGVHHYGLACDIVCNISGEPSWKWDFVLLGQLAHANKLIWGGDWGTPGLHHNFIDSDHVQRCTVGRQASLFNGAWYPDDAYDPYADLRV
ncbi:MAG TPA: M15 family metallopeptidase [Mucilaginibacter sp.]|nr:M15 family metallopeptidase [Mucilaginibacter sp.]